MRRWMLVPAVVLVVVLAGVWVTGALLTDDESVARALTAAWFVLAGVLVAAAAWRWRQIAVPALTSWAVVSAVTGGFLLYTSTVDRSVDEDVLVASAPDTTASAPTSSAPEAAATGAGAARPTPPARPSVVQLASGAFVAQAHPTTGKATLLRRPDGSRVVTLTGFETDPGPDLFVYLAPGDGSDVESGVRLGRLKGNKGDQQYDVPDDVPGDGSVVIWCRAFSVTFGAARLST